MGDIITDAVSAIGDFFLDLFGAILRGRLSAMFDFIDDSTSMISSEVAISPSNWNSAIYTALKSVSDNVLLPIGTIIITAILCYEIISMVVNQNHMSRDGGETSFFFIIVFKAVVGVYFLANCWDITMAIFDVGSHIVTEVTNGYLTGTSESLGTWGLNTFDDEIAAMNLGELIAATLEAILVNTAMSIMATLIMVVLYGRMMEIYMYISIAPIPFSTLLNKEWGMIGTNYIRTLCALAFQSFFIIICVVMFNALVANIAVTTLIKGMWDVLLYSALLCMMLFKSGTISRSIFNAH